MLETNKESFTLSPEGLAEIQKELKRYTKKKIEKSVFERFGIWLNKASKLNFE